MDHELKQFIRLLVGVVATTLFVVFSVAFLTLPYALGTTPGQLPVAEAGVDRHMT
ncbi:MAG: hypothetical protein R3E42_14060 [Burkholderiaceae bacterium]